MKAMTFLFCILSLISISTFAYSVVDVPLLVAQKPISDNYGQPLTPYETRMMCVDFAKKEMGLMSLIRAKRIASFDPDGSPFLRESNWTREQPQSVTGESVISLSLNSHANFVAQLDFIIELTDEHCLFNQIINTSRD